MSLVNSWEPLVALEGMKVFPLPLTLILFSVLAVTTILFCPKHSV